MTATVLLVDDSQMVRRLVGQALRAEGFNVVEAADGLLALAQQAATPADIVLCDINMPNMNGIEFLQALRAPPHNSTVPVVFLTTKGQLDLVGVAKGLDAKGWLLKPVKPALVVATVSAILAESASPTQAASNQ